MGLHQFDVTPFIIGGAEGDRTPDLMNAIHARSQLRHSPTYSVDAILRLKYHKVKTSVNNFYFFLTWLLPPIIILLIFPFFLILA